MTAGLVIAGGYSTRFGVAEKPLVEVAGESMLARVVRTVDAVVDKVVIDCRADQVEPFRTALEALEVEPRFRLDDKPDRGPIAGLSNGVAAIDEPETVVLSCDRPGVTPALLQELGLRREEDVEVALPAIDGHLQPLCGVYRTAGLREAVEEAIAADEWRLCLIPRELGSEVLRESALGEIVDPAAIASVDTPLEARLLSRRVDEVEPSWQRSGPGDAAQSLAGD